MGRINTVKRMKPVELIIKILLIQESNNRVQDNLLIDDRNWQSSAERYDHKGIEQDDYRKENNTAIWAR